MALTIAMPLSGLEPEHFYALGARLLYDQGVKSLSGVGNTLAVAPAPMSPSSGSETSGISSLATSADTPTPTATPAESRPASPEDTKLFLNITRPLQCLVAATSAPKILHGSRDLLNLAANIRGPGWPILHPSLPRDNPSAFMANRSLYYRLGEHGLVEEYPTLTIAGILDTLAMKFVGYDIDFSPKKGCLGILTSANFDTASFGKLFHKVDELSQIFDNLRSSCGTENQIQKPRDRFYTEV